MTFRIKDGLEIGVYAHPEGSEYGKWGVINPNDIEIVSAVSDLTSTPGATSVSLSWTSTGHGSRVTVYREDVVAGGGYQVIESDIPGVNSSYIDLSATPETEYNYYITATNLAGTSDPSNTHNVTTIAALTGFLADPDWRFTDNFEGSEDTDFWGSGPAHEYGADNPDGSGKCLLFSALTSASAVTGYNWTEKKFRLPAGDLGGEEDTGENGGAVQIEITYDLWVSDGFEMQSGTTSHQKFLQMWGGSYGVANSNCSINCELWPSHKVAANWGHDGENFGHAHPDPATQFMPPANGTSYWMSVRFLITLGKEDGEIGRIIMMKDDEVFWDTGEPSYWSGTTVTLWENEPAFSEMGNALRNGYLMGWQNEPYLVDTFWAMRNFEIKANYAHKNVDYSIIGGV